MKETLKKLTQGNLPVIFTLVFCIICFGLYAVVFASNRKQHDFAHSAGNLLTASPAQLKETKPDYEYLAKSERGDEPELTQSPLYQIRINKTMNYLIVYTQDDTNAYTIPYKIMLCATGKLPEYTPTGEFTLTTTYLWREMSSGMYAKYSAKVNKGIMIQSTPSLDDENGMIDTESFNMLGTCSTMGSIWLNMADAKWIYDNCLPGTKVIIFEDMLTPALPIPQKISLPLNSIYSSWDPTDHLDENPWSDKKPTIYAHDITLPVGSSQDLHTNVTARDSLGNDVSSQVVLSGNYDINVPGVYSITFSITDVLGNVSTATVTLTVKEEEEPTETIPPTTTPAWTTVPPETTTWQQATNPTTENFTTTTPLEPETTTEPITENNTTSQQITAPTTQELHTTTRPTEPETTTEHVTAETTTEKVTEKETTEEETTELPTTEAETTTMEHSTEQPETTEEETTEPPVTTSFFQEDIE